MEYACHGSQPDPPLETQKATHVSHLTGPGGSGKNLPRKMEKSESRVRGNAGGAGLEGFNPRTRRSDCSTRAIQASRAC